MARTRFHSQLIERVNEEVQKRALSLAAGEFGDYASAREIVAEIRGMRNALLIGDEIAQESE